ncbi:hypothetical protein [Xylella fastidiosa]|uniref:Uncharacterized protein n=1 Tax=Xylella fastidiosa subsp. multiplex TaxID=644357 RepID=A0AAW6HYQ3_XYLFS|nr:hypothetical protein [Xylella fastidiosa]KAJ4853273.1 hypothetical protein XYFPCFBP8418_003195 [Xylella fastidiosa subsp. multiplex]MCH7233807.1 hypothetical protein [Xylella fastidiosa subsp. multiplex]MCP8324224.1 hypothetical protein [Xylella fastidiosa subsp. multiplex]MDC6409494.1 hypothetical protein [Xylella fastidiosa subsp. multiplex]MDC6410338.1 hypothetical protein [Xylella fastidiosa subsp. multiplex]
MQTISDEGIKLIKFLEGLRLQAYLCEAGGLRRDRSACRTAKQPERGRYGHKNVRNNSRTRCGGCA